MIIGLIGYMRSGKTTAAGFLETMHGFQRVSFKDALVAEMKENFPDLLNEIAVGNGYHQIGGVVPEPDIWELFKEKPPLMRALMQNYGTEVRRKDDPNYWIKRWIEGSEIPGDIVVDDVRFKNEAEAVRARGGVLIRVERTDITSGGDHASETQMDGVVADYTISAGPGELDEIYKKIDIIYGQEKLKEDKG